MDEDLTLPIKPIGDFIIDNANGVELPNGVYYHYAEVCKLLNIKQREQTELIECIQNLMGVFDTPVARMRMSDEFSAEARRIGREVLTKFNDENYGR